MKLAKSHVRHDIRKHFWTVNLWMHIGLTKKWFIIIVQKFQEPEAAGVFVNKLYKFNSTFCHLDAA